MRFVRRTLGLLIFLLVACGGQATATQIPTQPSTLPILTNTIQPSVTPTMSATSIVSPELTCDDWQSWPVIPTVSEIALELYQRGQANGNHPQAFSKIGDGEISTAWFLTAFDLGEVYYDLGPYQDLRTVIDQFQGSFERTGMAARRGFNTHKILDPAMGDPAMCESGEPPLTCELRLHQPAFAILSLGTNQVWEAEEFETGMRQIIEVLLSQNVVPILSTKGDNLEGDYRINQTIACLAQEYDLPLWNFWSAIQPLPDHGLQPDLEHLTYSGKTDFDDADAMQSAWTVRNLTALQALDAVWRGVTGHPSSVPTPTSTPLIIPPTLIPLQTPTIGPAITADSTQVERWQEYEDALAKALFPLSFVADQYLCEWEILGRSNQEVYVWTVCMSIASVGSNGLPLNSTMPVVIHTQADGSVESVEIPRGGNDYAADIQRMFPIDAAEKYFDRLIHFQELTDHLNWRREHSEELPLIVLSATPTP